MILIVKGPPPFGQSFLKTVGEPPTVFSVYMFNESFILKKFFNYAIKQNINDLNTRFKRRVDFPTTHTVTVSKTY